MPRLLGKHMELGVERLGNLVVDKIAKRSLDRCGMKDRLMMSRSANRLSQSRATKKLNP